MPGAGLAAALSWACRCRMGRRAAVPHDRARGAPLSRGVDGPARAPGSLSQRPRRRARRSRLDRAARRLEPARRVRHGGGDLALVDEAVDCSCKALVLTSWRPAPSRSIGTRRQRLARRLLADRRRGGPPRAVGGPVQGVLRRRRSCDQQRRRGRRLQPRRPARPPASVVFVDDVLVAGAAPASWSTVLGRCGPWRPRHAAPSWRLPAMLGTSSPRLRRPRVRSSSGSPLISAVIASTASPASLRRVRAGLHRMRRSVIGVETRLELGGPRTWCVAPPAGPRSALVHPRQPARWPWSPPQQQRSPDPLSASTPASADEGAITCRAGPGRRAGLARRPTATGRTRGSATGWSSRCATAPASCAASSGSTTRPTG